MGAPSLPGPVPGVEDAGARREPTDINPATWEWSVRLFTMMRRILRVNVKLHEADGLVDDGQIFLFNHFARFETFIPQYLIYMENGAYCRSVASREFFEGDDAFSNYLLNLGAVPNDYHRLLPFLAEEVLRGRKIIAFPEGGMVKDRRVIDEHGEFSVYSRLARERRKHHSGAAVLALYLDAFKALLRDAEGAEGGRLLQAWSERLRMEPEALKAAVALPTLVVPANITFYPIRVSDNLLRKGAAVLRRGLSRRLSEELLIEGNILLKDTDMDIRLGPAVNPARMWRWWERSLRDHVLGSVGSMEHLFGLSPDRGHLGERVLARSLRRKSLALRDESMERMYRAVSVNLSHLAAQLIVELVARGERHVERSRFHSMLYLAVKKVQRERGLNLHRSLLNPEAYGCLPDGRCAGLEQLLRNAGRAGLLEVDDAGYRFLDKLLDEHAFDEVRIENLVEVYANESAPARGVRRAARRAVAEAGRLDPRGLARLRFDDELRAYEWDRGRFRRSRYAEINAQETATEDARPYLYLPREPRGVGVVLVHGFLASPAELRTFGDRLASRGHPVLGVRIKGHGTSPWDLRERSWQDWLETVRHGVSIMSAFTRRVCLVGFSTGGGLALRLAAECPDRVAGVVGVCVPARFRNKNMRFVPLVHGANRLVGWVSSLEGILPFRANNTENPDINYRHMPIRGLYELRRLVDEVCARLPDVQCPVLLMQGSDDPVVEPGSLDLLAQGLGSAQVEVEQVPAQVHGILYRDVGNTQERVMGFLDSIEDPLAS